MKISTAQEAINGNSNDTVITPLRLKQVLKSKNIDEGGSSGGITAETDPIFKASPAANITDEDINKWNSGTGGGGSGDISTSKMSKVLYDNPDGTNTTVQLTETYTNFKYLEVFCVSSDNTYAYTRIDNPVDSKRATVMGGWFGTYSYFKNCVLVLSGSDKINVTQGNASEITGDDNCNSISMTNAMKVVKVVGYYDENVLIVGNNGTEIVNTNKPKNIMTLKLDTDVTCVTGAYTHIPLTVYNTEGDGLIYENGSVKIGKGISKVKVSGCAKFGTNGVSTKHIHIDKNDTTIAWALENPASASLGASPKVTPVVIDVVEGDLIDLKYHTSSSGDVVAGHTTCFTYLTVEAVEDGQIITVNNTIDGIPIGSEFEYDGEEVPDGYEEVIEDETEDDTGWQRVTLTSYFKPYNNNEEYTPVYRRVGKLVEVKGTLSPSSAQEAGWTATMFTLPDGFRPSQVVSVLCQGSGQNKWQLMVNPNGEVVMDRYSGTSNVAIPATAWLIFQVMFFVD